MNKIEDKENTTWYIGVAWFVGKVLAFAINSMAFTYVGFYLLNWLGVL